MKKDKSISIERGSGLLQRAMGENPNDVAHIPSKLVSDFISRNDLGTTLDA